MSLSDWIAEKGVPTVATMLNVEPNTVRFWRIGHTLPRPEQMQKIRKLSNGVVGYEQIIDQRPKKRN